MADYQIAFKLSTMAVVIQTKGDALPAGFNKIGEFTHADDEPLLRDLEFGVNHVLWHHVREALYHTSSVTGLSVPGTLQFPGNITDMGKISITIDTDYVALTAIAITPGTATTLTVAAPTVQLGITKTPTNASNGAVTYVSSDPTKATVSATGLVTRVANGSNVRRWCSYGYQGHHRHGITVRSGFLGFLNALVAQLVRAGRS